MSRSGRGDRHAFEILVLRHQSSVLNFIYRFKGDRIEAEDLAQEVFLRAWQSAATYKPTAKFTTWIYRITANLCVNKQKSDRIRRLFMVPASRKEEGLGNEFSADHARKGPSPEDLLLEAERKQQVLSALRRLPANQKIALILKTQFEQAAVFDTTGYGNLLIGPPIDPQSRIVRHAARLRR